MSEVLHSTQDDNDFSSEHLTHEDYTEVKPDSEYTVEDYADDGERLFYEISGFPRDHRISPELKELFSTLSDEPDNSGFDVPRHETARFTALGLEYQKTRHRYNPQIREMIQVAVLRDTLNDIHDRDLAIQKLNSVNNSWQPGFIRRIEKDILIEQRLKYYKQKDILKQKQDRLKELDLGYLIDEAISSTNIEKKEKQNVTRISEYNRIDMQIVNDGVMSESELERFNSFKSKQEEATINFEKRIRERKIESIKKEEKDKNDKYERRLKQYEEEKAKADEEAKINGEKSSFKKNPPKKPKNLSDKEIENKADDYTKMNAKRIQKFVKRVAIEEANKIVSFDNNYDHPELIAKQMKRDVTSLDDANGTSYSIHSSIEQEINKLFGNSDEGKAIFQEVEELFKLARDRYVNLFPRYHNYANRTLHAHYNEINELQNQIKALTNGYKKNVSKRVKEGAEKKLVEFKNEVSKIAFPEEDFSPDDIYFFSTGLVALNNNELKISTITPMDKRIIQKIPNSHAALLWEQEWSERTTDHDSIARRLLEQKIKIIDDTHESSFEKRQKALFEKYAINEPSTFNPITGEIYDTIQPEDLDLLEDVLPHIGSFIKDIAIDAGAENISLKSTRLEVINYLSGAWDLDVSQLYDQKSRLKVRAAELLYHNAGSEKAGKVLNRIVLETGAALYNKLSNEKREEFLRLIGSSADISSTEFYRIYRRRIIDPTERREVVARSFFIKGFLDYTQDKANPAISSFIDSLKKRQEIG